SGEREPKSGNDFVGIRSRRRVSEWRTRCRYVYGGLRDYRGAYCGESLCDTRGTERRYQDRKCSYRTTEYLVAERCPGHFYFFGNTRNFANDRIASGYRMGHRCNRSMLFAPGTTDHRPGTFTGHDADPHGLRQLEYYRKFSRHHASAYVLLRQGCL